MVGAIQAIWANLVSNSDTGEHISDDNHELQYIPFPICNETGKPLELQYGVEEGTSPFPNPLSLLDLP